MEQIGNQTGKQIEKEAEKKREKRTGRQKGKKADGMAREIIQKRPERYAKTPRMSVQTCSGVLCGGARCYLFLHRIGRGGTAQVWKAAGIPRGGLWALKIRNKTEDDLFCLQMEAELLEELTNTGKAAPGSLCGEFPRFQEYFQTSEREVLVMEYLRGITLGESLRRGKRYFAAEILEIAVSLCGILEKLHGCTPPVLYLDLSPDNIILERGGGLRLTDLGTAAAWRSKEKRDGFVMTGTPGFAAPEQYQGEASPASDIYSLGMLLRVLNAFGDETDERLWGVREKLQEVIRISTQKDPARRYPDIKAMKQVLEKSTCL